MIDDEASTTTHNALTERLGLVYVNSFNIRKACRIVCGMVSLCGAIFCLHPQASMTTTLLGNAAALVFLYVLLGAPTHRHLTFESQQRLLRWLQEDDKSNDRSDI